MGDHAEGKVSRPAVTEEDYQATLAFLWSQARMVVEQPIAEMLAAAERADSIGAMFDPTLYRAKAGAMHEDMEMLRALRHVQTVMESIARRSAGR